LDNILISPLKDTEIDDDWFQQPSSIPNFKVCLADFGESIVYNTEEQGYTTRSCGTEFNKSNFIPPPSLVLQLLFLYFHLFYLFLFKGPEMLNAGMEYFIFFENIK